MIAEEIEAALGDLADGRVYRSRFPQEPGTPALPAIRFTVVSTDPTPDICGGGEEATDDVRVQFDVVAMKASEVDALRRQLIDRMALTPTPNVRQPGGFETWDAETRAHRAVLDFTFYQSSQPA